MLPLMHPNYFDVQRPLNDPYYQMVNYGPITIDGQAVDPELEAFLEAEDLTVYSEWPAVGGIAVALPQGQTVLDAVAHWPAEHPDLIESVDPDSILESDSMPEEMPNDDRFDYHADTWHLMPDNTNIAPDWWGVPLPTEVLQPHSANLAPVWGPAIEEYGNGVVVAIIDTGVDYGNPDLIANSYPSGFNTGDKKGSTQFRNRSLGGGEPWNWLLERSQAHAAGLGHGTLVAGSISAEAANDPDVDYPPYNSDDPRDVLGAAPEALYLPFAVKAKGKETPSGGYASALSMSALLNALSALGGAKGIYEDEMIIDPEAMT